MADDCGGSSEETLTEPNRRTTPTFQNRSQQSGTHLISSVLNTDITYMHLCIVQYTCVRTPDRVRTSFIPSYISVGYTGTASYRQNFTVWFLKLTDKSLDCTTFFFFLFVFYFSIKKKKKILIAT